jgi:ATP-dependent helicase HrpB
MDLPIVEIERPLVETLRSQKRVVLTAPTGSGKSTQVPQMLLDAGLLADGQVAVLQPRRLPTRLLASWVARARGAALGGEVGYQMRLENVTSGATRICYMTEGVLLRRMLDDPELHGIRAIVFDEFHERHLYGDITLARALQIQQTNRRDLIIIVMSATLDVRAVDKYLEPCAVLSSQGRVHPVTIEYLAKAAAETPIWELAVRELRRLVGERAGDVLIFMPGVYEIARTVEAARAALGGAFVVLPLHGELSQPDQDAAVASHDRRKVVVATNVAETSLTIDGVRVVIDSGLARIPRFDPHRGINTLLVEKISRASADQRAGRAGRTAPGHCLRLWTAHEHGARPTRDLPEIKRLDLAEVVLTLKASGVEDVQAFRWVEPPEAPALERATMLLTDLGAVDATGGALTSIGRRMLAFPVHPRYARMLVAAQDYGCVRSSALVAALSQGRELLARRQTPPADGAARDELVAGETESDFFVLMGAWRFAERNGYQADCCRRLGIRAQAARQAGFLFEQFLRIAQEEGLDIREKPLNRDAVRRSLLVAFPDHLAKQLDAGSPRCELVHGRRGLLARDSVVQASLFVAAEVREIESGGRRERNLNVMLDLATAVEEEWLGEMFPDGFTASRSVAYDPGLRRVVAREQRRFRDLLLEEKLSGKPPADEAAAILAREVASGRLTLERWDESVEQWIVRVNRLREWMPELELPPIMPNDRMVMLEHLCHGAFGYAEIKDRPVLPVVKSWLSSRHQQWVEQHAPEQIQLPKGRRVKVSYSADAPPTIAARIQDLYGVNEPIRIADGRIAVRVQVLAPSNRPVQITENLAEFWSGAYPKLKPQLQRRYPKHEWR